MPTEEQTKYDKFRYDKREAIIKVEEARAAVAKLSANDTIATSHRKRYSKQETKLLKIRSRLY